MSSGISSSESDSEKSHACGSNTGWIQALGIAPASRLKNNVSDSILFWIVLYCAVALVSKPRVRSDGMPRLRQEDRLIGSYPCGVIYALHALIL